MKARLAYSVREEHEITDTGVQVHGEMFFVNFYASLACVAQIRMSREEFRSFMILLGGAQQ